MSIGHHIQPVQNDSNSKLNEEHLYLKHLLSSVDRQVEHDNKHESLHQLLKLVKHKMVMNQTKYEGSLLLYLSMILLLASNDIELNPGPSGLTSNTTTYPYGTCDKPVTWDDRVIVCDTCNQWYHTHCQSSDTHLILPRTCQRLCYCLGLYNVWMSKLFHILFFTCLQYIKPLQCTLRYTTWKPSSI